MRSPYTSFWASLSSLLLFTSRGWGRPEASCSPTQPRTAKQLEPLPASRFWKGKQLLFLLLTLIAHRRRQPIFFDFATMVSFWPWGVSAQETQIHHSVGHLTMLIFYRRMTPPRHRLRKHFPLSPPKLQPPKHGSTRTGQNHDGSNSSARSTSASHIWSMASF